MAISKPQVAHYIITGSLLPVLPRYRINLSYKFPMQEYQGGLAIAFRHFLLTITIFYSFFFFPFSFQKR